MIDYIEKGYGLHEAIDKAGYSLHIKDGVWYSSNDIEVQKIIDSFDALGYAKSLAKEKIRKQAEGLMIDIENSYPSFERQTWAYQRLEVEAWHDNKNALTPTIDAIALAREVDRLVQLERTLSKTTAFKNMANHLAGRRQYFEDLIDNSQDISFVNSVDFEV